MELIRGIHNLREKHQGSVASIGNFDGVHLGHQKIITRLQEKAKQLNVPVVIITFEPQPREFFSTGDIPPRLTRLREKALVLGDYGVDRILCVRFNEDFVNITAEEFIEKILVKGLGIKYLLVGDDFRYGHNREGDIKLLQKRGREFGFEVQTQETVEFENERVSSTRVRGALQVGNLTMAEKLLGRHYAMYGRVAHGDKLGRQLGFPTANIFLHRHASPVLGVFAVQVHGLKEEPINGVANVGTRPAVGGTHTLLEVYLFDFNEEIYGKYVKVDFLKKQRDEEHYDSLELLRDQIAIDAEEAREFFRTMT